MRALRAAAGLLALWTISCSGAAGPAPEAGSASVELVDVAGGLLLEIRPYDKGYKLYDVDEAVVGKIRVKSDRVTLKDAADRELWKIKLKSDGGAEIEDASSGARLYRIKRDEDGTYKLRDADDHTLVKCRPKADGFEVRTADGETLAKVKVRDDRLAFATEGGERIQVLKGVTDARAGMWLAVDRFSAVEGAAVMVYFLHFGDR